MRLGPGFELPVKGWLVRSGARGAGDGRSQSVCLSRQASRWTQSHRPGPTLPVQCWFPQQQEAKLGSRSPTAQAKKGGSIPPSGVAVGCCFEMWRVFQFSKPIHK